MSFNLLSSRTQKMLQHPETLGQHDEVFRASFIIKRHSELVSKSLDNMSVKYDFEYVSALL